MSAVTCLLFDRYCRTYTFGAKNIIVCSPQPMGMRRRFSKPPDIKVLTAGPIRFPEVAAKKIIKQFATGNEH